MSGMEYLIGLAKADADADRMESASVTAGLMAAAGADAQQQIARIEDERAMLAAGMDDGRVQIVLVKPSGSTGAVA